MKELESLFEDVNRFTWKCLGSKGGINADCFENKFVVPPTVELKIDTQDHLHDVARGSSHALTWTSTNATTCTASSTDGSWDGIKPTNNAIGESVIVNSDVTYTLLCRNNRGVDMDFASTNLGSTLSLCTEFGIAPFVVAGDPPASRNLFPNMSEKFKAFYDGDPTDGAGTEVTDNWLENSANSAVSISGNGTTPQIITAGSLAGLTEDVTLTQINDAITLHYTIQPFPCFSDCSDAPNVCSGTLFNDANSCGINNCSGTRNCNYNWMESSP